MDDEGNRIRSVVFTEYEMTKQPNKNKRKCMLSHFVAVVIIDVKMMMLTTKIKVKIKVIFLS